VISIITPAYQAERFIQKTILSVLSQTYDDFELLVVDDASSDGTANVVRRLCQSDHRVRLISHQRNLGPAEARNSAVGAARGRFIAFLDSDDLWLRNKLQNQLEFMISQKAAFSFTEYRRMPEEGDVLGAVVKIPDSIGYNELLRNTVIATSTVMLDREKVGELRLTPGFGYDDLILWLGILKTGIRAQGLREDLMRYRVVSGSVSRQGLRAAKWVWNIYRRHEGLGVFFSAWCLGNYAWRAYWRHRTL
jgi:teichuronic acid biosynthesis glycosyltransferase TuaG